MSGDLVFPATLYGPADTVRREVVHAMTSYTAGEAWDEAFGATRVPVAGVPGLIVMNGPAPLLAGEPHFQAFLPLRVLADRVKKRRLEESTLHTAVLDSLHSAWALLGALAPVNQRLVYPPALHAPILRAAARHWDVLASVGARYTVGLREGTGLWETVSNLHYVLAQVGVDPRRLRAPLESGGLRSILPRSVLTSD